MAKSNGNRREPLLITQDWPIEEIELDLLRIDGGLQLRAEISEDHIASLAEDYKANQPIPPIRVIFDAKTYWVWDGNHRLLARRKAGFQTIYCMVEPGTYRDAILRAAGANAKNNALKRSNADKRAAVLALANDKQWSRRSNRWIAETCLVSHMLVAAVREELATANDSQNKRQVEVLPPDDCTVNEVLDSIGRPARAVSEAREGKDGKSYQQKQKPAATPKSLPIDLRKKVRNTAAATDPRQMSRLAKLAKDDPALASVVADMLHDCEVYSVEEALKESDLAEQEPQEEASAVLRHMLSKAKDVWRIQCPKAACPSLGAAVLEAVADEWVSGGWIS